ncbi:MAG: hypothetical protein K9W43_09295 [Candidatus Thorarchaeota archaeon]|nr:hypothetical protein [Candidatus Thorarchaeota archaeon]
MTSRIDLLLITTSRRTNNRVRTFIRDLSTVLPGSERFNRGGMSLEELRARIASSGCKAAFVITHYKGNPGDILVYDPQGAERLRIRLESAVLRREVLPGVKIRVHDVRSVTIAPGSSERTSLLGREIASLLDKELIEVESVVPLGADGAHRVDIRFSDFSPDKTLWTHFHAADGIEIGPRMRIKSVRWWSKNE